MWKGCSEMRERERKERGEIRMKTEGNKMDGRDMEEERKDRKRKEWGMGKKVLIFGIVFLRWYQESESSEGK
jgi:hypothetical protein